MLSSFLVWVSYGPLVSVTSHLDLHPLSNGDLVVANMTSNAGKGNLKPSSLARQEIQTAGEEQWLLYLVTWQTLSAGNQEWTTSLAKSTTLVVGRNSYQVFPAMQPTWNAGSRLQFINLRTQVTKYLKKQDKPKTMLIKKQKRLNKAG